MTPARTYQGEKGSVFLWKRGLMSYMNHTVFLFFLYWKLLFMASKIAIAIVALVCSEVWYVGMGQYETVPISQFRTITVIALKCLILKFLGKKKQQLFLSSIEHNVFYL